MSCVWEGIKAYFRLQKVKQEMLEKRTQMYIDQGYCRERASTEAANDMNIIDYREYNNIKNTLVSQGKW